MDINQIRELFIGQGLIFWAAVTAVSLGLTLLSVSIVFQFRKIIAGRRRKQSCTAPPVGITVTEGGYRVSGHPVGLSPDSPNTTGPTENDEPNAAMADARGPAPGTPDAELTGRLLARLRTVADRLEGVHQALGPHGLADGAAVDSSLKATGSGVDYVYKTGRA